MWSTLIMISGSWVSNAIVICYVELLYTWRKLGSFKMITNSWFSLQTHPPQPVPLISSLPLLELFRLKSWGHLDTPLFHQSHILLQQILKALSSKHIQNPNISLLHICSNLGTNLHTSTFSITKSVFHGATGVSFYYLFTTPHFVHQVRPHHTRLLLSDDFSSHSEWNSKF